ncbi:MAG TPA: DUF262 domain-containing protein [Gemmatimonadaceae bacterium]|nr:DUF262 domain-containing protein [Gemmatimonadaceae bacterium]
MKLFEVLTHQQETGMAVEWFEDYAPDEEDFDIDEYELTATPNDFNVLTIFSFMESGSVKIPGFQRNYVWDIKRASKLIESLILGLPVPQIFLYEEGRNRFLVIDGQQRLMSIYYFIKQRFPRKEKRSELRRIFDEKGAIPEGVLHDDTYFVPFGLSLPGRLPEHPNKFKGLNYSTLGDQRSQFDLRPVRNVIVKQIKPSGDDSSVFEMFNRLNTGGINLKPQEIRTSLYHSDFYDMLYRVNLNQGWRRLVNLPDPDLHMKDVEVLMRGFAMLMDGSEYRPSMARFLNQFSRKCKALNAGQIAYLEKLMLSFIAAAEKLPGDVFVSSRTKRFSIALYEAVFTAIAREPFDRNDVVKKPIKAESIRSLDSDSDFIAASEKASADTANVARRLERARALL